VDYLAGIGQACVAGYADRVPGFSGRRLHLKTGMTVLREYDHVLRSAILDELETLPGVHIHGIADRTRLRERVPTVSFAWEGRNPRDISAALGEQGIFVRVSGFSARFVELAPEVQADILRRQAHR